MAPPSDGAALTRLLLARHGRTAYNAARIIQGPTLDPPLDDVGARQAERLGVRLAALPVRVVGASPLRRARETAGPAARARAVGVIVDGRLTEIDWGAWNGRRKDGPLLRDLRRLARRWAEGDADARPPGGESAGEVAARALPAVRALLARAPADGDALVVAHGRTIKILLAALVHGDLARQEEFPTSNTGLTVLEPEGASWRARVVDCGAHLAPPPALAAPAAEASAL